MIVTKLVKQEKKYECYIDDTAYLLDEEVILQYRLFVGKKLNSSDLDCIIISNERQKYLNMAISYQLKYAKSSKEVVNYLINKGLSLELSNDIIQELIDKKFFNDSLLCQRMSASLARNSNGKNMIKYKLKQHLFKDEDIYNAIDVLEEEDIKYGKEKLMAKLEKKYIKLSDSEKNKKYKEVLYRHGY